mmetsp:Transcript_18679/g.20127  ORF Transcript_18679/g.20127 Transcript_18679/m.20127 type:complete len:151 (+) Transcript_18679:1184-1636(+)
MKYDLYKNKFNKTIFICNFYHSSKAQKSYLTLGLKTRSEREKKMILSSTRVLFLQPCSFLPFSSSRPLPRRLDQILEEGDKRHACLDMPLKLPRNLQLQEVLHSRYHGCSNPDNEKIAWIFAYPSRFHSMNNKLVLYSLQLLRQVHQPRV